MKFLKNLSKVPTMSNIATVTFTPWNSPAGFTALAIIQVKFSNVHFVFELSLPIHPTLISFSSSHAYMSSPALSTLIFTLLCSLSDEGHFLLTNSCFSLTLGISSQPFLQTCYSLTLDIASLYSFYFPESSSPSRGGGLFYSLSLIKYQQKWSCDLNDIRS